MNFEDLMWIGLGLTVIVCLTVAFIILIEIS